MAKENKYNLRKRIKEYKNNFTSVASKPRTNSKPSPNSKNKVRRVSKANSSHPHNDTSPIPKKSLTPEDFILSVASQIASQPLRHSDPDVWGVLTAISTNARKRHQGINMLLTSDEHCIGRLVDDTHFEIISNAVSGNHCKIYMKRVAAEDVKNSSNLYKSVFLKDTSTNGTYLNWKKLTKNSSEAELHHGDIISFGCPPQHEFSITFVFREVLKSTSLTDGAILKRKAEEFGFESKRVKRIGIGAPEGPISLDDFRSLQRSNMELRKQLEIQVLTIDSLNNEYRLAVESHENKVEELEHEMKRLRKELECEKAAREEARAKVSALEVEINAAMLDLDFERHGLKGAREIIMLRETQLRAFHSISEEIPVLFAKQQEQLKVMQRTLEDEQNHENTSVDIDLNQDYGNFNGTLVSVTDKHECDIRKQEDDRSTQEAEFSSMDHRFVKGGFGSDIAGIGTEPVLDRDAIGTERVLETESPRVCGVRNFDLNKCSPLAEDTMQLDDETHVQEVEERVWRTLKKILHHSLSNNPLEIQNTMEDAEAGGTIKTADLLASEVIGSWACSTAPSVHGEKESAGRDSEEDAAAAHDSNVQAAESQSTPCSEARLRLIDVIKNVRHWVR